MSAYFAKELPDQPFYVNGKAYKFELIQLDDPAIIAHFDSAAAKGVGGVVRLTEEEYQSQLKKKAAQTSFSLKPRGREEFKQKLPNYGHRKSARRENAVAKDSPSAAPAKPVDISDLSAYIPKTAKGLLN